MGVQLVRPAVNAVKDPLGHAETTPYRPMDEVYTIAPRGLVATGGSIATGSRYCPFLGP